MCIFTGVVEPIVSATKIFVALLSLTTQLTVYQNNIKTSGNVAMILPIPNERGQNGNVRMVDLSNYPTFFDDLERDFPGRPLFQTLSFGASNHVEPVLAIQRVGSYDVSIADNLDDLLRLDWTHFDLQTHVVTVLKEHYANHFAFCVARLRTSATPHPLAYLHPRLNNSTLFVPTRHEGHAGNAKDHDVFYQATTQKNLKENVELTLWDHTIFVYHNDATYFKEKDDLHFDRLEVNRTRYTNFRKLQKAVSSIDANLHLYSPEYATLFRKDIHGLGENKDVTFTFSKASLEFFTGNFPFLTAIAQRNLMILVTATVCLLGLLFYCYRQ